MSLNIDIAAGLGGSGDPGGALAGGNVYSYNLDQSLRFNNNDNAYLEFTPSSAGNRDTWTISMWVKRSGLGLAQSKLFAAGSSFASNHNESFYMWFQSDDTLQILNETGGSPFTRLETTRTFRDIAGWYHIVYIYDSTQAFATDRQKLYINGVQETDFDLRTDPGLNVDSQVNATHVHRIGASTIGNTFDGYMAEVHFIDGTALDADNFGETNGGVWVPKEYSGSYGTNGGYLDFSTSSFTDNASDPDVFADQAGSNDWNAYNFVAEDLVPDSPTNNFATWNPLVYTNQTRDFRDGNTNLFSSVQTWSTGAWNQGTIGVIGGTSDTKFYFEFIANVGGSGYIIGVGRAASKALSTTTYDGAVFLYNTQIRSDSTNTVTGLTSASPLDVIRIAFDGSNGKVWIGNASGWFNSGDPAAGTNEVGTISNYEGEVLVPILNRPDLTNGYMVLNFGQDDTFAGNKTSGSAAAQDGNSIGKFYYTPPSGFLALCSANLPEPTIGPGQSEQADDYFETILYRGNGEVQHIGSGGAQHPIDTTTIANSIRFNDAATHFSNTFGSGDSTTTFTISLWFKRSTIDQSMVMIGAESSSGRDDFLRFESSNRLAFYRDEGTDYVSPSRLFTDTSRWYHVVVAVDQTQATSSDRVKIYIDGVQETDFTYAAYPASAYGGFGNAKKLTIGSRPSQLSAETFDGYLAEINYIDGSQLGPENFGQTGSNGYWIPKAISGLTYGTSGFRIDGTNTVSSGTTISSFDDQENSNNFDESVTGVDTTDVVEDSPTQNFNTLNPNGTNFVSYSPTLSEGNLKAAALQAKRVNSMFGVSSGKWYFETKSQAGDPMVGVALRDGSDSIVYDGNVGYVRNYAPINGSAVNRTGYATWGASDIIGVAFDVDNNEVEFFKNNTSIGTFDFPMNSETVATAGYQGGTNVQITFNFGADDTFAGDATGGASAADGNGYGSFYYTPPTDYLAMVDDNIPQEGLAAPDFIWLKHRASASYTHQLVDTVRGKLSGAASFARLRTDTTAVEATPGSYGITEITNAGFTVGNDTSYNLHTGSYVAWTWKAGGPSPTQTYTVKVVSDSGNKYRFDDFGTSAVTLELQEGGTYTFDQSDSSNSGHPLRFSTTSDGTHNSGSEYTTGVTTTGTPGSSGAKTVITVAHGAPTLYYYCSVHSGMGGQANTNTTHGSSNFDGSIQSVVSANQDAGFSIVSWTGTGDTETIGHGLSSAPEMIIVKNRDDSLNWHVYHKDTNDAPNDVLFLNLTNADTDQARFNDTTPTASVFSIGDGNAENKLNDKIIAYCFHSVEGYSKVGSYIGNGLADGTFVHTGFRPTWVLLKDTDATSDWQMYDSERYEYNQIGVTQVLEANATTAETTTVNELDFLSNGFKFRSNNTFSNKSASTFIYLAFAEAPFKYANAR